MIPIANVAPLITLAIVIYNQVGTAKKNVRYCRRLADEIRAMEPILRDIEARVDRFPQFSKEMIDRALDLLLKDYQAALEFIQKQTKISAIKKFVIAKTTEEDFQDINNHIRDSRDIFMLAMVNKIDAATSNLNTVSTHKPLPPTPGSTTTTTTTTITTNSTSPTPDTTTITPTISNDPIAPLIPTSVPARVFLGGRQSPDLFTHSNSPDISHQSTSKRKMEDLRQAFSEKKYDLAVKIGKDILKNVPPKSETSFMIYLSIACSFAITNSPEDAMTYLHSARENGWDDLPYLECEDLNNLRSFPEFIIFKEKLVQELNQKERWRTMPQDKVDVLTRNFERYDIDGSGTICDTEFRVLLKRTSALNLTDTQIQEMFEEMDVGKSGQVDLNGYLNYMADHRDNVDNYLTRLSTTNLQDVTVSLSDFSLSPNVGSMRPDTGNLDNSLLLSQFNSSSNLLPHSPLASLNHIPTNSLPYSPTPAHDPSSSIPHSPYSPPLSPHSVLASFSFHSAPPDHTPDTYPSPHPTPDTYPSPHPTPDTYPNPHPQYSTTPDVYSSGPTPNQHSPYSTPPYQSPVLTPHHPQQTYHDPNYQQPQSPHASYHPYTPAPYSSLPDLHAAYHTQPSPTHLPQPYPATAHDPYAAHAAAAYQSQTYTAPSPYYATTNTYGQ